MKGSKKKKAAKSIDMSVARPKQVFAGANWKFMTPSTSITKFIPWFLDVMEEADPTMTGSGFVIFVAKPDDDDEKPWVFLCNETGVSQA